MPWKEANAVSGMPDLTNLKRVAIRTESTGRVKDLKGFTKGHSKPDRDSAMAKRFIAQIAAEDIKADIDETYQTIRESFGFKRRQLESSADGGAGVIRTPKFEYFVTVHLDPRDTAQVVWRREVTGFRDPLTVRSPEFISAFGNRFSILVFEFEAPVSVEEIVDGIEDDDRPGVKVACARDASSCEIALAGYLGLIRIDRNSLTIEGSASPSAASLLDQFFEFLRRYPRAPGLK